jgi:hypothetical protein
MRPDARGDGRLRLDPFSDGGSTRRRAPQRPGIVLAVFAVLFQAILFGWHHHELYVPTRDMPPVVVHHDGGRSAPSADDDDACDICTALHHQSASPVEIVALPPYRPPVSAPAPAEGGLVGLSYPAAFQSRAPPLT